MRQELQELKDVLELLADAEKDLQSKLEGIDQLLGAPYAKDFPEATLDAIADDVLRYNMMLKDMYAFITRRISGEIRNVIFQQFIESADERMQNHKS
jgi:hypothetical protein